MTHDALTTEQVMLNWLKNGRAIQISSAATFPQIWTWTIPLSLSVDIINDAICCFDSTNLAENTLRGDRFYFEEITAE